jgi:hypothetical protein
MIMKPHIALIILLTGTALAQGPLTPPPGADPSIGPFYALTAGGLPQATMKTLHQVEPRTAIPGGTAMVMLNQSGSYYLTADITVADGPGVVIAASGVNLDLNGFSIVSSNTSPDFGDAGVGLNPYVKNISVRNGTISGNGASGKFWAGVGPTGLTASSNVSVTDVTVSDTTHWGIVLDSTNNSRVERCFVETQGITGAISARLVNDCSATGGGVFGRIVRNCSVETTGSSGIVAEVAENCYAISAGNAITAKCLVNSYGSASGFSSYALHTVSAGVASNVWAQGYGGTGDAISASTVANSVGQRPSDPSPVSGTESQAVSAGSGIKASIVHGSLGVTAAGKAIDAQIVNSSQGTTGSGKGIFGVIVTGSNGAGSDSNSYGIEADLISQSRGFGLLRGLTSDRGMIAYSIGKTNSFNTPVIAGKTVVIGVNATNDDNFGGIVLTGGLAANSFANGFGIEVPDGLVSHSVGKRVVDIGGLQGGIKSSLVTGSKGIGSSGVVGILADLINGSHGSGTGGTTSGALEFNSN